MSRTQQRPKRRPAQRSGGPDLMVIGAVVAVTLLVALLAIIAVGAGSDSADDTAPEFGAVEQPTSALPPLPEAGPDPALGLVAPTVLSERPDGSTVVDPATSGEPTMLVFLAHWCPHCQAELPRLVESAAAGTFDDVRTVAVLTGTDTTRPNHPPSAWLADEGWTGEQFYDDANGSAATAYGLTNFPFIVFLDADGTVALRVGGEQSPEAIEAAIHAITQA